MKKLFLLIAIVALASCGQPSSTVKTDSTTVIKTDSVKTVVVDTTKKQNTR